MRPTSLAVRGLKCWDDKTFELGQFTAIQGPNGCLVAGTLIDVPRNLTTDPLGIAISTLVGTRPLVYAFDIERDRIVLTRASAVWQTSESREVVRVSFSSTHGRFRQHDGLVGTPDHPVMLIDGSYRALGKLRAGDRLMPLRRRLRDGVYAAIAQPDGSLDLEHRLVAAFIEDRAIGDDEHVHHRNENQIDNAPANLEALPASEHIALHGRQRPPTYDEHPRGMLGKEHNVEARRRISEGTRRALSDPEIRARLSVASRQAWAEKDRPWTDEGVLRELYAEKCLSTVQIGDMLGASAHCIRSWLVRFDIPRRDQSEAQLARQPNHRVLQVESAGREAVYDIEVPDYHNFVANGVVVHNSGKTAIIQAIRLALLGYDPETGRKLDQTRKLIAPDAVKETAEIGLSFDNGFGIRRRFGKTTKTEVLPPRGESNGRECQARIDEETGGLVISLDLATFFDLSDEKRRAWLFEHLPLDGAELTWEIFARWTDAREQRAEPANVLEHLGDVVRNLWEHNVKTAPNPAVGLGSAIEAAHREFLEVDRMRLAQSQVVERGAENLRTEDAPEPVDDAELEELEERLASTNQRIGEARAGREAREAIENRIREAADKAGRAEGELAHIEHVRDDIAEQLEGMDELDTRDRADEVADLEADVERLQDIHEGSRVLAVAARNALDQLVLQKARVEKYGPCPYALLGCEQDTEGMRDHVLGGLEEELLESQGLADTETAAEDAAREASSIASERVARVRIEIRDADTLARQHAELERSLESKATVLEELREREQIHASAQMVAEDELEDLGSDDVLAGLYEERDRLVYGRGALRSRLEAVVRHSERVAAHDREAGELEYRTTRATALKELDGNLRRLRGHVIQKMIEPLQEEAEAILATMDPRKSFRFIFERGNASTLELCFVEDGVTRLFDAASKGERVMLTVAFLGALLSVINPAMKLLVIDDLEQLDDVRRRRLMIGLIVLRDRFDAVLVAGACQLGGVPGWDLVDLETGIRAGAA